LSWLLARIIKNVYDRRVFEVCDKSVEVKGSFTTGWPNFL